MLIQKETLEPSVLAAFDLANFDESHRMDEEEWQQMLSSGYVAMYTIRNEQDELVAVIVLKTDGKILTDRWYFYSVAVSEQYRKMHLATKLFQHAIGAAIACGSINSHCHVDNIASIKFHQSLGFRAIQYVPDFYGDYEDAILWERPR